jgi:NAD(P)-dependent dehydrogenase (short-subunit alcohol dehydrogenase family)
MTTATAVPTTRASRIWLITGASRGLGLAFTRAALERGDRVAAAARTTAALDALSAEHGDRLLVLPLDVTDRAAVFAAVARADDHFGSLDIVVNNAGALFMGMAEEFTEEQARGQMEVNFFGALWVTQAVLPRLRARGAGHLVQISSIGALGGFPATGMYSASKFALEGLSEAVAMEAGRFGVKVTIVEPGGYWTGLYTHLTSADPDPAYDGLRAELQARWADGSVDSEPRLAAGALLKLVDSEEPPLRLLLGSMVYDLAMDISRQRMATWAAWEEVSRAAEKAVPMPESMPGPGAAR